MLYSNQNSNPNNKVYYFELYTYTIVLNFADWPKSRDCHFFFWMARVLFAFFRNFSEYLPPYYIILSFPIPPAGCTGSTD